MNNAIDLYQSLWAEAVNAIPCNHWPESVLEEQRRKNASSYHLQACSSKYMQKIVDALLAAVRSRGSIRSVLEIAAGTGVFTLPLAKVVDKVTVIDPSPGMLAVLRQNIKRERVSNVEIIVDSWPYDLCGKTYDLIVAANCLLGFNDLRETFFAMLQSSNQALCLINPMNVRPIPYDPELRRHLEKIDHGSRFDCLPIILGILSLKSVYPLIRIFNMQSWEYPDIDKLHDRWAEALNLVSEEDYTQLKALLNNFAMENDGRWRIPGFSFHFFLWANLTPGKNTENFQVP